MSRWPIWRTPPFNDHVPILRASVWLLLVGPLFLAALVPALGINLVDIFVPTEFFLILLLGSPILAAPAMVCAVPTAIILARGGWAGWLSAGAAGAVFGCLFFQSFEAVVPSWIFIGFGGAYGLAYWLILRWQCPEVVGLVCFR